jgi:predicted Zn-dependent protease
LHCVTNKDFSIYYRQFFPGLPSESKGEDSMKYPQLPAVGVLLLLLPLIACSTVPVTGRKQLDLIPQSTMLSMSTEQYQTFLKSNKISRNKQQTQLVRRVGWRIQKSVEQYFTENNLAHELEGYAWEFNLVDSDPVNAWAMPGGKVVVYTGILPVTKNEEGLAVVMGHEVAHAVVGHGDERMSQALIFQMGGMALSTALANEPERTRELWLAAFGAGAQYGILLPYSRLHESEADHLGLIFMAMAGYNPNAAVSFWKRMSKMKGGKAPPEILSTHPSDQTRIQNIRNLIPQAMTYYKKPK